ncbi:MAG: TRAP transporter large permease subunit, partial [Sphaerochaetaceae bacterium]|nr:TRAP transporter large permease subunit [Sphaerochaetaceae bacterium]
AILAEITPPVSIASYCGAAIAGSDPLKTGFEAMKLATVGFIIPYIFVFNPALMLNGSFLEIVTLVIVVLYAVITLASAFRGYLHRVLTKVERSIMGVISAALIIGSCNLTIMHNMAVQIAILASAVLIVVLYVLARVKKSSGGTAATA